MRVEVAWRTVGVSAPRRPGGAVRRQRSGDGAGLGAGRGEADRGRRGVTPGGRPARQQLVQTDHRHLEGVKGAEVVKRAEVMKGAPRSTAILQFRVPARHNLYGAAPCPALPCFAPCPNSLATCPIYIAPCRIERKIIILYIIYFFTTI